MEISVSPKHWWLRTPESDIGGAKIIIFILVHVVGKKYILG